MIQLDRIYIPEIEQHNAINAAADKDVKRDDMANRYLDCMIADAHQRQRGLPDKCDYKAINAAILARWAVSGLNYIKKKAWKMLEEMR